VCELVVARLPLDQVIPIFWTSPQNRGDRTESRWYDKKLSH
jgi:hypothetical protein